MRNFSAEELAVLWALAQVCGCKHAPLPHEAGPIIHVPGTRVTMRDLDAETYRVEDHPEVLPHGEVWVIEKATNNTVHKYAGNLRGVTYVRG